MAQSISSMTLEEISRNSEIDPNAFSKVYKLQIIKDFTAIREKNKKLNQEQICKLLGTSVSTIIRIRKDLNIPSPFRYTVPINRKSRTKKKIDLKDVEKSNPIEINVKEPQARSKSSNRRVKNVLTKTKSKKNEEYGGDLTLENLNIDDDDNVKLDSATQRLLDEV